MSFNYLPQQAIEYIALHLDPYDLITLSSCSKQLCKRILKNDDFWKSKSILDFGDIFQLYQIFTKSTGLELPSELTLKYSKEPDSWYDYYVAKSKSINKADDDVLLDQGNREYQEARQCLNGLQEEVNHSMLVHVASKMFWILDVFPGHAGGYYILGFILYILNQFEDALDVLDMGRLVDPTFEPFNDLEDEIIVILEDQEHKELPMIVNENLSPELFNILLEIFYRFDKDKDDCLNYDELSFFVFSTNGEHPSDDFLKQMSERFGANEEGWLTKEGFLAFYLEQTLDDPSETAKDIRMHGFNWETIQN